MTSERTFAEEILRWIREGGELALDFDPLQASEEDIQTLRALLYGAYRKVYREELDEKQEIIVQDRTRLRLIFRKKTLVDREK